VRGVTFDSKSRATSALGVLECGLVANATRIHLKPVASSEWLEGPAETVPTRVAAVTGGDLTQLNARNVAANVTGAVTTSPNLQS
jgi:hypothetical protein